MTDDMKEYYEENGYFMVKYVLIFLIASFFMFVLFLFDICKHI